MISAKEYLAKKSIEVVETLPGITIADLMELYALRVLTDTLHDLFGNGTPQNPELVLSDAQRQAARRMADLRKLARENHNAILS